MWIRANPNPCGKEAPDCVVRAICIAMNRPWHEVYWELCELGAKRCNMPSADSLWGEYLYLCGFEPFLLRDECPRCATIATFCKWYPRGRYIIGTGNHAVAVIDGNYYDSWDSGNEIPSFFWQMS